MNQMIMFSVASSAVNFGLNTEVSCEGLLGGGLNYFETSQ